MGESVHDTSIADLEGSPSLDLQVAIRSEITTRTLAPNLERGCRNFLTGDVTPAVEPRTSGVHARTQLGISPESGAFQHRVWATWGNDHIWR